MLKCTTLTIAFKEDKPNMTAEEALKVSNGSATLNQDGSVDEIVCESDTTTTKVDNMEVDSSATVDDKSDDKSASDEPVRSVEDKDQSNEASKDEDKVKVKDKVTTESNNNNKKYTRAERQKHAFKVQRDKLKESKARIKELEDKLAKYDGLDKDKFDSEDKYIDYKIDMKSDKRELERLKNEQTAQQMEYANDLAEQRIKNNFSDEKEEQEYRQLLDVAMNNFDRLHPEYGIKNFADLVSEDRTVLEYLADSDNAPRLIRHFIAKPESLLKIMRLSSPLNKHAALDKMEQSMLVYYRSKDIITKRKPLPSTGRVVNNKMTTVNTDKWNKKWSAADALNYLKNNH